MSRSDICIDAAEAMDFIHARGASTCSVPPKLDGFDFRREALSKDLDARACLPAWWDAEAGRLNSCGADLSGVSCRSAHFSGAQLEQANFLKADLAGTKLNSALLCGANFNQALLEDVDLSFANARFATFHEAVLEGANLQNADLWGAKFGEADADHADFRDAQLEEANFQNADARSSDFRQAKLGMTDFRDADIRMSDFRGAILRAANFDGADARRANFEQLDLSGCSLRHVWLSDAKLRRSVFHRDQLGGAIGEEVAEQYELAYKGYLGLEQNFSENGDLDAARWAYLRRRRMEKLATWGRTRRAIAEWDLRSTSRFAFYGSTLKLMELLCDYGESVSRILTTQLFLFCLFALSYEITGAVLRDNSVGAKISARVIAKTNDYPQMSSGSVIDVARYSLSAMIAPGNPPENLHAASPIVQLCTLVQSFFGVFLTGLLGFVAGNRIRR